MSEEMLYFVTTLEGVAMLSKILEPRLLVLLLVKQEVFRKQFGIVSHLSDLIGYRLRPI